MDGEDEKFAHGANGTITTGTCKTARRRRIACHVGIVVSVEQTAFWSPRQFKLLGYIEDRRHKTGLIGMMRMSGLEGDVADVAKQTEKRKFVELLASLGVVRRNSAGEFSRMDVSLCRCRIGMMACCF